jgi:hypothetical protein
MRALEAIVTWRPRPPFLYGWLVLGSGPWGHQRKALRDCGQAMALVGFQGLTQHGQGVSA